MQSEQFADDVPIEDVLEQRRDADTSPTDPETGVEPAAAVPLEADGSDWQEQQIELPDDPEQ